MPLTPNILDVARIERILKSINAKLERIESIMRNNDEEEGWWIRIDSRFDCPSLLSMRSGLYTVKNVGLRDLDSNQDERIQSPLSYH